MESYELGIRKIVEQNKVEEWHLILAKPNENEPEKDTNIKKSDKRNKLKDFCINFIHRRFWKIFISISILLNFFITLSAMAQNLSFFLYLAVFVHFTCFLFWIDFIAGLVYKILAKEYEAKLKARKVSTLIIEGITLIPISLWYLLSTPHPNQFIFWSLRFITLLRFYRVQYYISELAIPGRNFWNVYFLFALLYLLVLMNIYCSIFIIWNKFEHPSIKIHGFGDSDLNNFVVALYFTLVTMLNIGYGDIVFKEYNRIWMCTVGMVVGFTTITGILTGILATKLANLEKDMNDHRQEYSAILKSLKKIKTDKQVIKKVSYNMKAMWRYREGYFDSKPHSTIFPESIQKEIDFDINFGILNRSLVFCMQPKPFLRSISNVMRNASYLPGDFILEPGQMANAMICIFSGVVEVVSDENYDEVLFSLAAGSVICEICLLISLLKRQCLRASTYVEVQILQKKDFYRLALKHPEISRAMRKDIHQRLDFTRTEMVERSATHMKELLDMLRQTKFLLDSSKRRSNLLGRKLKPTRATLLSLYVVSENIPRVKSTPINILRGSPWILRPHTFLTETWNAFNILVILGVVFMYPYLAGFVREITEETFMFLHLVQFIYVFDIYVQCTTAVKRKDHFTYVTDIKELIALKLKSPGFYVDIIATLNFTAYADLTPIKNRHYAVLLFSQNKVFRVWNLFSYFHKLENNWNINLIFIRFVKYIVYFSIIVVWAAATLYVEACPEEMCHPERWFSKKEQKEVEKNIPDPLTEWPALVSIYWSCVSVTGVGYGDIVVAAILDCAVISFWIVIGAFAFVYFMAEASATMKNSSRVRAQFQEEVFSVNRFLKEYNIPFEMQQKVINYFRVQWYYDEGYTFKDPQVLKDVSLSHKKILVEDLMNRFLVVPFLRDCDVDFLKTLVTLSKFRIFPPDEIVVEKGSVSREMFILDAGFCIVSQGDDPQVEFTRIINAVNAFGYAEMILGLPIEVSVRTLTHCKMITLDYYAYLRAVTIYPLTKAIIDEKIQNLFFGKQLSGFQLIGIKPSLPEKNTKLLWKQRKMLKKPMINVYEFHQSLSIDYWEPFQVWGKLSFFKYLLMPLVFTPKSKLMETWMCLRSIRVLGYGLLLPPHYSLPHSDIIIYYSLLTFQILGILDMYLMFHVAYYNEDGILVYHPSRTAISYLRGNFIIDLLIEYPISTTMEALIPPSTYTYMFRAFGLIKVLQTYKYFQLCFHLERDIRRRSEHTKILKFLPLAFLVTNVTTGLIIIVECFSYEIKEWLPHTSRRIELEFQEGIHAHCSRDANLTAEEESDENIFKFYLIVFYWVSASMTTSGFGDISAHNRTAMFISIFVVGLGLFLYGYMFASLTSNMISSYTTVTKYRKRIKQMGKFLNATNVNPDLKTRLRLHYEFSWIRTEGSRPQRLLAKVHTSLRENLMSSMYEDTIKLVQSFELAEKPILNVIGGFIEDVHFLCGQIVVNYKDILEHFYVIHRGIVEVLDENGETVAFMGKGGIFGNIANTMFALSSVTVIARKNLEILKMESDPLFKALEINLNSRDLLLFLSSLKTNFLKPINAEEDAELIRRVKQTVWIDTLAYKITFPLEQTSDATTNIVKFKFTRFFRIFATSFYRKSEEQLLSTVILPDSFLYNFIEMIVLVLSFISGNLAAYIFFFNDLSLVALVACYTSDFLYVFKIPLTFSVSYCDRYGEFTVDKQKIRKRYIKSRYFIYDVLSSIPIELFAFFVTGHWALRLYLLLHLNRLLRFYCINKYFAEKSKALMANKTYLHLWWTVFCVATLLHFTAGFWYFQACPFDYCQESCWVIERHLHLDDKWAIYSNSIYFIVALFTTTGFGDISVYTVSELSTAIVFMVFSQFCIVLLAGSMATVVYDQILNVILYEGIVLELESNFRRLKLNRYQMFKMWRYVSSLWTFKSREIPKFIRTAPYALKCETMYIIFGNHLSQSYIFSTLDEAFLRQLAAAAERSLYFEGDYIVHQGDIDQTMYFICRGQVSVLTIHSNLMETVHLKLEDNDHFGTSQGLLSGRAHHFSYRAESAVEILTLTFNKWKHLLKYFPHCETEIYSRLQNLPHLKQTNTTLKKY